MTMEKKPLVLIMKNPGTTCNIGCVYCAEERKKYISVDTKIEYELVDKIANLTDQYSLNVLFHGGEPTILPVDYYKNIIEVFTKSNPDVYFGLQTNGTLINDEWIQFLKDYKDKVGVSVSLDGTKEINRFRLTKDKKETFDTVKNAINQLADNGLKTGMICTIVSSSLGRERELIEMLMDFNNLLFVKLNPCFDLNHDGTIPYWGITPDQYVQFVINFFTIMFERGIWNQFFVEPIISAFKNLQNVRSSFCNFNLDKCSQFISLYPDGTITSCDNYTLKQGKLGDLNTTDDLGDVLTMKDNPQLLNDYHKLMNQCETCEYEELCKGGCIAVRMRYNDTNEYCVAMKKMFNHFRKVYEEAYANS